MRFPTSEPNKKRIYAGALRCLKPLAKPLTGHNCNCQSRTNENIEKTTKKVFVWSKNGDHTPNIWTLWYQCCASPGHVWHMSRCQVVQESCRFVWQVIPNIPEAHLYLKTLLFPHINIKTPYQHDSPLDLKQCEPAIRKAIPNISPHVWEFNPAHMLCVYQYIQLGCLGLHSPTIRWLENSK